jgi:hypothetical protein
MGCVDQVGEENHRVTTGHRRQNHVDRGAHLLPLKTEVPGGNYYEFIPGQHNNVAEVADGSEDTEGDGDVRVHRFVEHLDFYEHLVDGGFVGQLEEHSLAGIAHFHSAAAAVVVWFDESDYSGKNQSS